MAYMSQPWEHPKTGRWYLRRQIPANLRPAFDHQREYKRSLGTKEYVKACQLFIGLNAEFEQRLAAARQRLATTGDPGPSKRDQAENLVRAYFEGPPAEGGLDGPERLLLAFLELDRGLWDTTPTGCSAPAPSSSDQWWELANNAALFRDHSATVKSRSGRPPAKVWRDFADGAHEGERRAQAQRVIEQIARHNAKAVTDLPDGIGGAIIAYLDEVRLDREVTPRTQPASTTPSMRIACLPGRAAKESSWRSSTRFSRRISPIRMTREITTYWSRPRSKRDLTVLLRAQSSNPTDMPRKSGPKKRFG